MKYFFLIYFIVAVLVVANGGFRGDKFSETPIEIFNDMDTQDKVKGQKPSTFFADGLGSRRPVFGTVPKGGDNGVLPVEFGVGRSGYYYDGKLGDKFGNGLPKELNLETDADSTALLARGEDMYGVHCAICHGDSGDGKGVVGAYFQEAGVLVANIHGFPRETHPDGYIYEVIANGKGLMGGYKHNLPVRDRWAIVAYLRALQASAK
ncbi:MAG: c-type cytochrome [Akkermansiaceae bacterium]